MDKTLTENKFYKVIKSILHRIWAILTNPTLVYTVRRILSAMFTLLLLLTVVTTMIRLIPDTRLYDLAVYNKIAGTSQTAADNYRLVQLFKYGRVDLDGNRIPILKNVLQYLYYILPIPKSIPITWNTRYTEVLRYWEGLSFLGISMDTNELVTDMMASRIGISFKISMWTVVLAYIIGYPLGIAMAKKPGGFIDKLGTLFVVLNYAIPALVFYLLMNKILGAPDGIFGALNFGYFYEPGEFQTLVAPIFSMVFLSIPGVSIWVRRFMVDQLSSDYVKFARSKGLTENRIMYVHVLRNALVPLIRNFPAVFIFAIIGSYYVEVIWGIPGTGNLLISALRNQEPDVPVIQGLTLIYSAMSMVAFLLGDIVTVWFDPRIKLTSKGVV